MRIVYFGDFDPNYARNRVILKGLRENGLRVGLCNVRQAGIRKYWRLARCVWKERGHFDVLIVGHSDNRWLTPLAKLLTRKPVIWDGFYSLYDSWVYDRRIVAPGSPKAWYYWLLDWMNCHLSNSILADTNVHIEYFVRTLKIPRSKFTRVFIGTDDSIFKL